MTIDEAIRILDPETTLTALCEIEYYAGFRGKAAKIEACDEACRLAVAVMRAQLTPIAYARWIEEPGKVPRCPVCGKYSDDAGNGAMICPWCGHRLKQDKEMTMYNDYISRSALIEGRVSNDPVVIAAAIAAILAWRACDGMPVLLLGGRRGEGLPGLRVEINEGGQP